MESLNFLDYQINHIGQTILMYPMPECPVGCSYCFEADFFAKKEGYNRELIAESLKKIMEQRGQKEGDYKKNTNSCKINIVVVHDAKAVWNKLQQHDDIDSKENNSKPDFFFFYCIPEEEKNEGSEDYQIKIKQRGNDVFSTDNRVRVHK